MVLGRAPDSRIIEGYTPIWNAIYTGNLPLVKHYIEKGADLRAVEGNYRQSYVFWATSRLQAVEADAKNSRLALLRLLVEEHGLEAGAVDTNGQTALFYAARHGHCEACNYLMNHGCNPAHVDTIMQETALFYASAQSHADCIKLLIDRRCPPDQADVEGCTALFHAGSALCVEVLARAGCDINVTEKRRGLTPAMSFTLSGKTDQLRAIIDAKADLNIVSKEQHSVFAYAKHKMNPVVSSILDELAPPRKRAAGKKQVRPPDPKVQSHVPMTRSRKKEEASPPVPSRGTVVKQQPSSPPSAAAAALRQATAGDSAAKSYLKFTKEGKVDFGGSLYAAICEGTGRQVGQVLEVGFQYKVSLDNTIIGSGGQNWMFFAAARPPDKAVLDVCKLLWNFSVDACKVDENGQTPLFYAVRRFPKPGAGAECAKWLIEMQCDPNHADARGQYPMSFASQNDDASCAKELLLARANVDTVDSHGYTYLTNSVSNNAVKTARVLLVEGRCNPNEQMEMHQMATAIFYARSVEMLNLLLEYKADLHIRDASNRTPLMMAAWNGSLDAVKAMVRGRADVNAKNNLGQTCLSLLAEKGERANIVNYLIQECGMDKHASTRLGPTIDDLMRTQAMFEGEPSRVQQGERDLAPKRRRVSITSISDDEAAASREMNGGDIQRPRDYAIGFTDRDGVLLPFGSTAYREALQELIELCPELQPWWNEVANRDRYYGDWADLDMYEEEADVHQHPFDEEVLEEEVEEEEEEEAAATDQAEGEENGNARWISVEEDSEEEGDSHAGEPLG